MTDGRTLYEEEWTYLLAYWQALLTLHRVVLASGEALMVIFD